MTHDASPTPGSPDPDREAQPAAPRDQSSQTDRPAPYDPNGTMPPPATEDTSPVERNDTQPSQTASKGSSGSGDMPFLDHLEELRWRLLKVIAAVLVGAIVSFVFSDHLMKLLTYPYEEAVFSLEEQRAAGPVQAMRQLFSDWFGGDSPARPETTGITRELPVGRRLQALKPMTYFFLSLQISLLGGVTLALPVLFYQTWKFLAPGLLQRERRLLVPIVLLSVLCFATGALVAYWIVLPLGLRFFLALEPPDMTSQWAVDEYLSFVMRLLLGFGLVFEMPVLAFFLARLGLITAAFLRQIRRYAVIGIFVVGAIFTPPDPISQMFMAMPLLVLYEISVWVARLSERKREP